MSESYQWYGGPDRWARQANKQFRYPGHLISYITRTCPLDRTNCGACPISGCDNGELRNLIKRQLPDA